MSPSRGGSSDFLEVVAWLKSIGYTDAEVNANVVAVDPGVRYSEDFAPGFGGGGASGRPATTGVFSLVEDAAGPVGLPVDIDEVVNALNPIEGDYQEAGFTDSSVDTNKGSVNGLAEYTSTILDDEAAGIKMSGALWATTFSRKLPADRAQRGRDRRDGAYRGPYRRGRQDGDRGRRRPAGNLGDRRRPDPVRRREGVPGQCLGRDLQGERAGHRDLPARQSDNQPAAAGLCRSGAVGPDRQ